MAVARAPVGGGMTGIKVALIVFVCLTVASLTFTIVLYTHQADLDAGVSSARDREQKANADKAAMQNDVSKIAQVVTGDTTSDPTSIQSKIETAVGAIMKNDPTIAQARIAPDSAIVSMLQGIHRLYRSNLELLTKTTAERDALNKQLQELDQSAKARAAEFVAKTTDFDNRIKQLEEQNGTNQKAWNLQVDELKRRLDAASASATSSLGGERQMRQKLEKQLEEKELQARELADKLAKFQPGMDTVTPQQIADGEIVRAISTEGIVYIGLGKRERITPGMPFSVYSRSPRGNNVQEKATIEVINVFDITSEARVKSTKAGEPIVEGDLVANLVYDRNRQYRFVVAGDFDLDFDGKIDQPGGIGGQDVIHMIEKWGGQVAPGLDSSVDFVVLGAPPVLPVKLPETATPEAKAHVADQTQARQVFDSLRGEAKAMSIPVLTRTQFLHFIGKQIPPRTPEDQLAAQ